MFDAKAGHRPLAKFPAFDGFRGIGVIVVVFSHMPLVADSNLYNMAWKLNQAPRTGLIALDIFFAISGFFITRLLLRERAKTGRISFSAFYLRRALRIFPVYILAVAGCLLLFRFTRAELLSVATYTFNFYHPFHPAPNPLEHTWSLSVEEQFYFFWPLLVLLVPLRHLDLVTGRIVPLLAVLSGLVMSIWLRHASDQLSGDVVYMSIFTRMLSLSLGGWLAVREFEGRPLRGWPCVLLLVLALAILMADRLGREAGVLCSQALYWTIALMAYGMISVAFVATMVFDDGLVQRALTRVLSVPLLRGVGHLSYAWYVFHLPVLFYLRLNAAALNSAPATLAQAGEALAISFGLALLSYVAVENPLARLKANIAVAAKSRTIAADA